jgi:hypothetical protein
VAKKRKRKYSPSAGRDVESEIRRYKRGTAKSGRGGKGGKVKSRRQAIHRAIEGEKERKARPEEETLTLAGLTSSGDTFAQSLMPLPGVLSCCVVHCSGFLSGRQRTIVVPWRKRPPEKWS